MAWKCIKCNRRSLLKRMDIWREMGALKQTAPQVGRAADKRETMETNGKRSISLHSPRHLPQETPKVRLAEHIAKYKT